MSIIESSIDQIDFQDGESIKALDYFHLISKVKKYISEEEEKDSFTLDFTKTQLKLK